MNQGIGSFRLPVIQRLPKRIEHEVASAWNGLPASPRSTGPTTGFEIHARMPQKLIMIAGSLNCAR